MASFPGRDRRLHLRLDALGSAELETALANTLDRMEAIRREARERAETGSAKAERRVSMAIFMTKRRDD